MYIIIRNTIEMKVITTSILDAGQLTLFRNAAYYNPISLLQ